MKVVEIGRDSQPGSAPYPLTLSILPFCNDAGQGQTLNFLPQHLSNGIYPSLNKSHMRLFHHFTTVTSGTLILGPQLWERKVMPTAFKVMPHTSFFYHYCLTDSFPARLPHARFVIYGSITFTAPPAPGKYSPQTRIGAFFAGHSSFQHSTLRSRYRN